MEANASILCCASEARGAELYPNCDSSIWLRSCDTEVINPIEGEITGEFPSWLNGSLLRNGPGSLKVGNMTFDHLFDSSALLHRFAIHDGCVTYQCRFLQSTTYKKNQAAKRIVVTEFGTRAVPDPCHSIFDRVSSIFKPGESISDNAMISLYPFGDEIYAFTEGPVIHRIDPQTLDTLERKNLMDYVALVNHTSHPHVMSNGDVYNVGMSVVKGRLQHVVVRFPYCEKGDMFSQASVVASMKPRWPLHPAYMHTFGVTEHYFVIVEQPLAVSLCGMVRNQLANKPLAKSLRWYSEHETNIVLLSRKTGKEVKRYRTETLFFLHIINSYEKEGRIILDLCAYKDAKVLDAMYVSAIENMQNNADYAEWFRGRPKRLEMDLEAANMTKVTPRLLIDLGCETPRIHYELHNGVPYRYFYAISSDVDSLHPGSVIKVDTATGNNTIWNDDSCYPSEPVFVPAPDARILVAFSKVVEKNKDFYMLNEYCAMAKSEVPYYPNYDNTVFTRTCEQEVPDPISGKITGEIPSWLRGTLLRNGPGSFKVGDMKYNHLFDGSALLHRFAIADGGATYQCRFLQSETYKRNRAANRIVITEFGTHSVPDPCHSIFDRIALRFQPEKTMSDNSTVSVYPFGDEIYALTEVPIIHRIDPVTLDTLERKNLTNVIVTHTAHPHVMPNGDVYNTGLKVTNFKLKHVIIKFPFTEKGDMFKEAVIVGSMKPRFPLHPSYMHSFGVTENYFVIVEQPLTLSLPQTIAKTISNKPISGCLKWRGECDTHIVLISRKTGEEVKRFVTPSIFYMHMINSFERNGSLLVDLCSYNDASIMDGMYIEALENLQSNPDYADWFRGRPRRIEVQIDAPNMTSVKAQLLTDELTCEMPRIHYDLFNGKPYRYFYALGSDVDCETPGMLVKVDTKTGETKIWSVRDNYACEPVFVPAPDAKEEDDGVLLSVVLISKRECELALVVLDAHTMREIARAHFTTPSPAAKCLHGWFLPA